MFCVVCNQPVIVTVNPYTRAEHPEVVLIQQHDCLCLEHATVYYRMMKESPDTQYADIPDLFPAPDQHQLRA